MTPSSDLQEKLRRYLLGELDEERLEEIEKEFLLDDDIFDELLAAEDALIDDYLNESLNAKDRAAFDKNFRSTPEREELLKFGRAFHRHLSRQFAPSPPAIQPDDSFRRAYSETAAIQAHQPEVRSSARWGSARTFFSSPWRAVAFAVVVLAVGFGGWYLFIRQSAVDEGLLALNAAYREQRPIESRISRFDYAPYVVTRGPGEERVQQQDLRRAELMLLNEQEKHPTPAAQHALGKFYLAKKDFDQAIKQFDKALKSDPNNAQIYSDLGAAWLEKGRIDREGDEPGKGMEELGQSLEYLNKALEVNPNLLEALFNRALCRQQMLLTQQAAEDWREYLKRDPSSMWAEEAKRQLRLIEEQTKGTSTNKEKQVDDYLAAYQEGNDDAAWMAIRGSRERKGNLIVERLLDDYLKLITDGLTEQAGKKLEMLAHVGWLEFQKSGDQFTSDLVAFYKTASPEQRQRSAHARTLLETARTHYYKVEFERALAECSRAQELFSLASNEPEALFADSWIGYCNLRIPKAKESLEIFGRLVQIYERKHYRSLQAQSVYALSDAELTLNEFSKALNSAESSLKISEAIEDQVNVVRSHGQIVSVLLNLGSYRESLSSTFRGLTLAKTSVYDPTLLWHFYHESALAYYYSGLRAAAFDSEAEAKRLADTAANPLLKARSLDRQALFYEQVGDHQMAIRLLHEALAEAENISGESSRSVTQVHTTLSLGQLYRETGDLPQSIKYYDQTLELSQRLNDLQIYLYQAHKGKFMTLVAMHNDVAADQELGTVISLFETYRDKIADETYRDKFFDLGQNTYDLAIDFEYSRRADSEKAFEYAEACRARSLFDLIARSGRVWPAASGLEGSTAGIKSLRPSEIQSQIPEQAQVLQYAVLDDKVLIWVVTRDDLKLAETKISATALTDAIRRFRERLAHGPTNETPESTTALATQLYEYLITPVESRGYLKPDHQLCIVPDKGLNFLPFAALISPTSGRYLIETFTLQLAPSATIFVMNSQSGKNRLPHMTAERLLAVGNPRFDRVTFNGLPDLPAAAREAQQVAGLYKANPLLGDRATLSKVRAELQHADVVHFATHALLDERSPLFSKLLLANETWAGTAAHHSSSGFLEASELYRMKLPRARLVVLSACQSGIEKAYGGEGAISLARPFLAAGVPLVVASLWSVDAENTADLMISFHKHRKLDRLSTSAALRQAQIEAIQNSRGSGSPYNWAAFVPIGGYTKF